MDTIWTRLLHEEIVYYWYNFS